MKGKSVFDEMRDKKIVGFNKIATIIHETPSLIKEDTMEQEGYDYEEVFYKIKQVIEEVKYN